MGARTTGGPGADLRSLRWLESAMKFNADMLNEMALRAASPPSEQALGGAALLLPNRAGRNVHDGIDECRVACGHARVKMDRRTVAPREKSTGSMSHPWH